MPVERAGKKRSEQKETLSNFLPSWVLRIGSALAGAIGLSGLLYACGFVATRSHQTFWGFWGGPTNDAPDLVAEGGRFFYHLSFVLIDLLNPFTLFNYPFFYTVLIIGVSLCICPSLSLRRFIDTPSFVSRMVCLGITLVPALVTYVFGWIVLINLANVMTPSDVLTLQRQLPPDFAELFQRPKDLYFDRICEWLLLIVIFVVSLRMGRLNHNVVSRIVVVIGGLFLLAATSLLPAVYGRLILLPEYQQITFTRDENEPVERVLIRMTGPQWIVWNVQSHTIEVITLRKDESVTLGRKRLLSVSNSTHFQGEKNGKP